MTSITQAGSLHPEGLAHTVALAAGKRSAETTHLAERLMWVGLLVLLVIAVYALMWRSWKRRGARHHDLPELLPVPPARDAAAGEPAAPPIAELTGRYHGTTTSGDWLDRVVARGLGSRSLAELTLRPDGIAVRRPGAADFLIPAAAVRGARLDKGIAGKVLTEGGLLVITWEHGGHLLDSGFRADHPAEHATWIRAVRHLVDGDHPDGTALTAAGTTPHHQHDQEGAR
ncbi:hypothetical protein GCM10027168_18990 [Streptomyces capparidis]